MRYQTAGNINNEYSADTHLFCNNCFLLKSQEKDCMTINVFQHGLQSVNCFFFLSLHSAFCDPCVMTTNGKRNFDLQTRFLFEISLSQTKRWKFCCEIEISLTLTKFRTEFCHLQRICEVKFRTSTRNFVNAETIEARKISPKIRSPRNFTDLRRIS